jgi:glycosyltransferase involved in cell wall biosynthesis
MFYPVKTKIFISYHSTEHHSRKEDLLHKIYIRLLRRKEMVVMVSQNQADYTIEKYELNRNQVITIHNGVNTNFWKLPDAIFDKNTVRNQFSIPSAAKVIVLVAAFRPEKNHLGAVKALIKLHTHYNLKACLLFVGHGMLMDDVKAAVAESNMEEYVKFAGLQSDLRPFYWSSDLFTLTSTNVETFSVAALEGMACGLPAVLTDIGGASEMIDPDINGLLTATSDEAIAAAWNKALSGEYSKEKIHKYIDENFNAEKMISRYAKMMDL